MAPHESEVKGLMADLRRGTLGKLLIARKTQI
jgi:hypothetical protein